MSIEASQHFSSRSGQQSPHIQPSPNVTRLLQGLSAKGYLVIPPSERRLGRENRSADTIHQRILRAFHHRRILGQQQSPNNLSAQGFTDAEVSDIIGHSDLHRRTAELRTCGLITQDLDGERASRTFKGARGTVSIITPAGIAALRELAKGSDHEATGTHE